MTPEDAFVDALLRLMGLSWNGVESFEDGDVIGLSVMKVDGQMGNSSLRTALRDPGERWGLVSSSGKPFKK
jgi:hypothetical protein